MTRQPFRSPSPALDRVACLLLLALSLVPLTGCHRKSAETPNVFIIVTDTTRADKLGLYGYHRPTSPRLDEFGKRHVTFDYAVTSTPWTPPAIATILSGLYATSHNMVPPNDRGAAKKGAAKLSSNVETIAELLKKHGYRTFGLSPNPWITKEFNYDQGFDTYQFISRAPADQITTKAIESVDKLLTEGKKEPILGYIHYLDPHDPYTPPEKYAAQFTGEIPSYGSYNYPPKMQKFLNLYDGEIRFMDEEIGRFFDYLKSKNLYESAVIVVVGDHGEQFTEHGDHRHGFKLFNEELHVPLLLKTADGKGDGSRIPETVTLVDIFPTLLTLAGIQVPPTYPGVFLLDREKLAARPAVFTEILRRYDQKGVVDATGRKLILETEFKEAEDHREASRDRWSTGAVRTVGVYDFKRTPFEDQPLNDTSLRDELRRKFDQLYRALSATRADTEDAQGGEEVSEERLEELRSLGYLQ